MKLSRRHFLGGAGALVALPALESMAPRRARAQSKPAQRFVVYFLPNGRVPETWIPNASGAAFELPSVSASLAPFKEDMIFCSGLYHTAAQEAGSVTQAGDHAKGTGPILTCAKIDEFQNLNNDVSLDQALVQALAPTTRFPSLQWGAGQPAACDFVASCVYTHCISWSEPGKPLSPVLDPLTAFNELFGGTDEGATAAQREIRRRSFASVLDYVLDDAGSFATTLNAPDRNKLDEYFTAVRELEQRLTSPAAMCETGPAPGASLEYPDAVRAFNDLMVLALRCDQSRFITFMIENGLSGRSHPFIDAEGGHHALSHFGNDDDRARLLRLETWQCEQAADLATKLKAITEPDGSTLLDNTALLLLPDMGFGNPHDHTNLAPVVIGKAGGALATGQSLAFSSAPLGNLYVTLLQAFGVATETFGMDGVAALPGLLA